MPSGETPTLIPCAACGGEWRVFPKDKRAEPEDCRWCTQGCMNDKQLQVWKNYRLTRPIGSIK